MTGRTIVATIGAGRVDAADLPVELGDQHPTQHAPMRIHLRVEDDVVVSADPEIGFMHRSAEKLFEVRDYRQVIMLGNRHDWISPLSSEVALALAIEEALGLVAPERATWARMLLVELTRISAAAVFIGAATGDDLALSLRARFLDLAEQATGQRVHPMFMRIGGLAAPLADDWLVAAESWLADVDAHWPAIAERSSERWSGLRGVAVLTASDALGLGVTGPALRASGVALDLRVSAPTLFYDAVADLLVDAAPKSDGDIPARFDSFAADVPRSRAIAARCLDALRSLGPGPIDVTLPKVVRLPEMTQLTHFEGPLGIASTLIDSVGDKVPWRVKLATPSFAAVQALGHALVGVPLPNLSAAVASFFIVVGDADR